jgi:hypothetical protein
MHVCVLMVEQELLVCPPYLLPRQVVALSVLNPRPEKARTMRHEYAVEWVRVTGAMDVMSATNVVDMVHESLPPFDVYPVSVQRNAHTG